MKTPFRLLLEDELNNIKKDIKEGLLLDIGCGKWDYKFNNVDIIKIDFLKFKGVNLVADAHSLPFKNNCFDFILCLNLLEHVKKPEIVVKEIRRCLKNNGKTIISIPFLYQYHPDPIDLWRFTPENIKILLKDFEIIKKKELGRVYTTILEFLYDNSPVPHFLINIIFKILKKIEKRLDKKIEHTMGYVIVAGKKNEK